MAAVYCSVLSFFGSVYLFLVAPVKTRVMVSQGVFPTAPPIRPPTTNHQATSYPTLLKKDLHEWESSRLNVDTHSVKKEKENESERAREREDRANIGSRKAARPDRGTRGTVWMDV